MVFVIQFPSMNHSQFCLLYFEILYFRFSQWWRNIIWSRLDEHVVWWAVFQRNILLASSGVCLEMGVVYLFRTLSIPDDLVSVWKETISMLFGLKWCHEMEGEWGLVWNSSYRSMISHTTFYRNKDLFYNSSSVYTALPDNMGGHLWASKLLITCGVITGIIPLYICISC